MKRLKAFRALFWREWVRFFRTRSRVIGSLLTPILFWVLLGGGFGRSLSIGGAASYGEFFLVGAVLLAVLFTAIFATLSVIEDRKSGFVQGILVAPVSRSSFVLAKVFSGAALGTVQGVVMLALGSITVVRIPWEFLLPIIVILFSVGMLLTALSFFLAWYLDSVQGFHSVMNLLLMPMWILSGAVFPLEGSHLVFRMLSLVNPLSPNVVALRAMAQGEESVWFSSGSLALLLNLGLTLVLVVVATKFMEARRLKPSRSGPKDKTAHSQKALR